MSSDKEFVQFILEQLSGLGNVSARPMMGEYVVYYNGKVVGGIFDNRFLVKPVESAKKLMPECEFVIPYETSKGMLSVDNVDDRDFLENLLKAMYDELPETKNKRRKIK